MTHAGLLFLVACQAISPEAESVGQTTGMPETRDLYSLVGEEDWKMLWKARQVALEENLSGKSIAWKNPRSGLRGTAAPIKTWKTASGVFCRSFDETIRNQSGAKQSRSGTACRDSDKIWKQVRT